MKLPAPTVDYRKLRISNIGSDSYKHLMLLLYWPVYGLLFLFVERFYPASHYTVMHCAADDLIPFFEWFLIPYLFWFVYMAGMHVYTLLYDTDSFCRMMKHIILSYSITIVIYLLWPTCQQLRPESFARDNLLTRFIAWFYRFDTNTNVCPSLHVIGSFAVMEAGLWCKRFKKPAKAGFVICTVLISVSTVFMKQHSVLDVLGALPICCLCHFCFFRKGRIQASEFRKA